MHSLAAGREEGQTCVGARSTAHRPALGSAPGPAAASAVSLRRALRQAGRHTPRWARCQQQHVPQHPKSNAKCTRSSLSKFGLG